MAVHLIQTEIPRDGIACRMKELSAHAPKNLQFSMFMTILIGSNV